MAGNLITSTATFANTSGTPADPTTVTLKYLAPGGTVQTVVYPAAFITRVSTGVYSAEFDSTGLPGLWVAEWLGTGTVQAANATTWTITQVLL